jgi:hypothetical protein
LTWLRERRRKELDQSTELSVPPLREAVPGGDGPLRAALWQYVRPMLSPALVELNQDAFVIDERVEATVDLDAHRPVSSLTDLELEDPDSLRD